MDQPQDVLVQASEMPWQPFGPSTWIKVVHVSLETGLWSCLLKLDPGAQFTRHFHKGAVDFFVLKGVLTYRAGVVREGGFVYEPLGVLHEATLADEETIVFAHFYGPVEFLDADDNVILTLDWKYVNDNLRGTTHPTAGEPAAVMSVQRTPALT